MMGAGSLRAVVSIGLSFRWLPSCPHAGRGSALEPHVAQRPARSSRVQASGLERARPMAVAAFAGGPSAQGAAPPDRRYPERERRVEAEGKTKGGGTGPPAKPVCTWGWRGTRSKLRGAARCTQSTPGQQLSRASHARVRCDLPQGRS